MRSMTGYGEAHAEDERQAVSVRLRSVNGRYLDLNVRLREEYRVAEKALRDVISGAVTRGRVEATVDVRPRGAGRATVVVHREVVEAVDAACRQLVSEDLAVGRLEVSDLLRVPEAFEMRADSDSWTAEDEALLLTAARSALAQLVEGRGVEGAKLAAMLEERIAGLEEIVERLLALRESAASEAHAALRRRIEEALAGVELDPARLEQELVYLIDKSDVSEELDRLAAHLEHFRQVAAGEGALGKRLDFLTQEIFRELNTLAAKCRHQEMSRAALDGKVLCEQLREQVQNVE